MSEQLVSYYDALVTRADYNTLDSGQWLNDNIISFALEYMDRHCHGGDNEHRVTLLDPTVCQAVKLTGQATSLLAGRNLMSSAVTVGVVQSSPAPSLTIAASAATPAEGTADNDRSAPRGLLCVVSDSDSPDRPGGAHWSLLAVRYSPADGVLDALHADSMSGRNAAAAGALADALHPALCRRHVDSSSTLLSCTCRHRPLAEAACAQQANGYDCGAFALLFAERLLAAGPDAWDGGADSPGLGLNAAGSGEAAAELRLRYRRLILQLRAEGHVHK